MRYRTANNLAALYAHVLVYTKTINISVCIFRTQPPYPSVHNFRTMCCPPFRIVVLDSDSADAQVLFDSVIKPWRFVSLPAGELILEMDPGTDYTQILQEITQTSKTMPVISHDLPIGEIDSSISISLILFSMFADALSDLGKPDPHGRDLVITPTMRI
jgi:hypothetical protein